MSGNLVAFGVGVVIAVVALVTIYFGHYCRCPRRAL